MRLVLFFMLISFTMLVTWADAGTYTQEASFNQRLPLLLKQGEVYQASISFTQRFSSIQRVCFRTYFSLDLADPGDGIRIGPIKDFSYGWRNISQPPFESRPICLSDWHTDSLVFLDGRQAFAIQSTSGSMLLEKMTVSITGTVVETETVN
ncbi:hypothetical protein [Teredinibacter sp. KSP-S5-2]|uniref:hypothetical protein n=1 Tax=Teredinibacter sp. KSP-S5-2 TaxID=3034506 RepID=UPI00293475FA|nr:hypothetical protein [Teredinibacter sp. KSP-S5-2]WNO10209.1 hypothetical protein P5V12_03385 [Teredinibacter sp. KSP-S5-2]